MLYTIYAITKITEEARIEASSKEEALSKAVNSPDDYSWFECAEVEVEYEAE